MRAVWFNRFGSSGQVLQIGELPKPEPGYGEVLVKLYMTGVNPSDVKKRAGAFPHLLDSGLVVPHSDGAGEITAVGAGVAEDRIGQRVFVYQAQHERSNGTAAEYIAIDELRAPLLPSNTSFEVGACIGIPILTAHRCVFADGKVTNKLLLVTGGAGRVGYYAIQWAKFGGARVLATASNESDAEACRDAGAEFVVNHRDPCWPEDILRYTDGEKIDRAVDVEFGANLVALLDCLRVGAEIVSYSSSAVPEPVLPFKKMMFMDLVVRMVIVYDMPEVAKAKAVKDTQKLLQDGALKHRIAEVIPLDETARAHQLIESGESRGCVLISV